MARQLASAGSDHIPAKDARKAPLKSYVVIMPLKDDVLAAPLSVLGLSVRASNALLNNGFSTVGDVLAKTEIELWQLPGVGPGTMMEIKAKLSARGLTLRPDGRPRPERK